MEAPMRGRRAPQEPDGAPRCIVTASGGASRVPLGKGRFTEK
eukprot:gene26707-16488_t